MIEQFSLQVACLNKRLTMTLIYTPSSVRAESLSDIQNVKWNMGCGQLPNKSCGSAGRLRAVICIRVGRKSCQLMCNHCSTEPSVLKVNCVGSVAAMQPAEEKSLSLRRKGGAGNLEWEPSQPSRLRKQNLQVVSKCLNIFES